MARFCGAIPPPPPPGGGPSLQAVTSGGGGVAHTRTRTHTRKHSEVGCGQPEDRGVCGQQKQSNDLGNNQHNPQYANYWAPLTPKRHIPPHPAQPQHTNDGAPRTRKRHPQEHRPQRPTERSDPTQHAEGRTGDCPGPRKETTTRRNVTRGVPPGIPPRGGGGGLTKRGRLQGGGRYVRCGCSSISPLSLRGRTAPMVPLTRLLLC